jgi:hypothetical protein
MTTFVCKRCGYECKLKHHLLSHLKRKNICDPKVSDMSIDTLLGELEPNRSVSNYKCEYCSKQFNNNSNRYRHQKICKLNPLKVKDQEIDNLKSIVETLQTQMNKINTGEKTINTNNGTINNIQQNNNITIQLKSFGFENIAHIESDIRYLTQCLLNKDVTGLLENIHCDKNFPENHNVRIKSLKKEFMETFVDGRWIVTDQEETLDELLNKGYRILNFFSYRNKDNIVADEGVEEYREMRQWLESLYHDHKIRKPLKRKMLILFMNNKTLFLEKEESEQKESSSNMQDTQRNITITQQVPSKTQDEKQIIENDDESDYYPSDCEELSQEEAAKLTWAKFDPSKYKPTTSRAEC